MRSALLFRILAFAGIAVVILADGAALLFVAERLLRDDPLNPTDTKTILTAAPIVMSAAGVCMPTAGFSGRAVSAIDLQDLLYVAPIVTYGAVFLAAGWRLRMSQVKVGPEASRAP